MPTYARFDVAFERGEGVYLYAVDGRRFLDFGGGVAVTSLGHCHPHLVAALKAQADSLWHCSNLYNIPGQERLAGRLVDATFADAVFFNNSGAEAVELGIKMARKYQSHSGHSERYRMITVEGAFHGRSLATIAAGGQEKHLAGFGPVVDGFDQVAYGNLNEMRAAITPETAGLIVEPVQGEGGIRPMPEGYLKGLRQMADEFGLVLVYDEVQCGIGRTGKLFSHEWSGDTPDVLASAKGLGGGFPVGACLATEKVAVALEAGSHGSTFGGNPLAMAVANAVLDVVLADGFLDGVNRIAKIFWARLQTLTEAYPAVVESVRGSGLMVGLKCAGGDGANLDLVRRLMTGGLLAVPAGDNVVRFVPPLIINESHIDEAMAILETSCRETAEAG
jgi:acetylornithine/N-succinyldiaminopimelate aminotransferase